MNWLKDRVLFSLKLGSRCFAPKLVPTIIVLLLVPLLLRLGFWQLDRAHKKQYLQQHWMSQEKQPPIPLAQLSADPNSWPNTKVTVMGTFDNNHPILLDNQIISHQVGYQVFVPFLPQGEHRWLLINRGWLPQSPHREQLPSISAIHGAQTLMGKLQVPSKPFLLSHQLPPIHWPLLLQAIQLDKMSELLQRPFFPFVMQLAPDQSQCFTCVWSNTPVISAQKHRAYAIQWFSLAIILMCGFFILSTSKIAE